MSKYSPFYDEKIKRKFLSLRLIKKSLKLFIYLKLIKRKDLEKIYVENLNKIELKDFQVERVLNNKSKRYFCFSFSTRNVHLIICR